MANLYYCDDLAAETFEVGATIEVTGDEARHAVRVSRLRTGERTLVGNGVGAMGRGEVTETRRESFTVTLAEAWHQPRVEPLLTLVQALAKGDRDERAVEQSTEFGVDVIVPWQAARSVSRWDGHGGAEKAEKGVAKWSRIAREASKQSLRAHKPVVPGPATLESLCDLAASAASEVIVLHPESTEPLSRWLSGGLAPGPREYCLVVGPEGGLTEDEVGRLRDAGARVLALGPIVLRTSSAGPAALALLNVALGRW